MHRNGNSGYEIVSLTVCAVLLVVGFNLQQAAGIVATKDVGNASLRTVTFRSHLSGSLDDDPRVRVGESVRVAPARSEPMSKHDSIIVKLPAETPFSGNHELYYLRGFTIGQLSAKNLQFL
jgi:hypothetical protein